MSRPDVLIELRRLMVGGTRPAALNEWRVGPWISEPVDMDAAGEVHSWPLDDPRRPVQVAA